MLRIGGLSDWLRFCLGHTGCSVLRISLLLLGQGRLSMPSNTSLVDEVGLFVLEEKASIPGKMGAVVY